MPENEKVAERAIVGDLASAQTSGPSPIGFCEYCRRPIFEPYCTHAEILARD